MKKHILTEILFLKKKWQEALEKKLDCKFIRINASKENYEADYEILRIQNLLVSLKTKELEKDIKQLKEKNNYKRLCKKRRRIPAQYTWFIV